MSATTRKVLLAMLYFHIGHNRIQTQPQIIEWHPFLTAWYNVDILDVAGMACNWLEFTVADLKIWCTWNNFELWLVCFCYSVAKMAFIFGWYSILDDVVCGWTGMTNMSVTSMDVVPSFHVTGYDHCGSWPYWSCLNNNISAQLIQWLKNLLQLRIIMLVNLLVRNFIKICHCHGYNCYEYSFYYAVQ